MVRITIFIIALLLAIEAIEPRPAWFVTLTVLSGIELLRMGPFWWTGRRSWRRWRSWAWDDDDW